MKKNKSKSARNTQKRVLIVDDHPVVRQGLIAIINNESDLLVCGEADSSASALDVIQRLCPDIVLVDISLGDEDGLDLIKDIVIRFPALPSLVISMHNESVYAERALRAGARGYCTKQQAANSITTAIRRVLAGEIHLSEQMVSRILQKAVNGGQPEVAAPVDTLSDRELGILRLIGQGFGNVEIADQLHLSVKTVETHRQHIKQKLDLPSATELNRFAIEWTKME